MAPTPKSQQAAVAETHSAVVFFHGDRAYKVKKPVDLGFLDFRNREAEAAGVDALVARWTDSTTTFAELEGPDLARQAFERWSPDEQLG